MNMDETPPTEGGAWSSVSRLIQTLRDIGENRIELFLLELQEERVRLFDALFLLAAGIICVLMTLILITFAVIVVFWDTHRLLVLGILTGIYGVAAVAVLAALYSRLQRWQAFAATLDQIKKDSECFKKPN